MRVIDYKSGTKDFNFEDLLYGINMQMLLYLFAVTDGNSDGKFSGAVPSGVLYMPAKDAGPSLARDDDASDENVRMKAYNSTYRMKGAVLCENGENDIVINAMEKSHNGNFIPVKFTKDGNPDVYSKYVTLEEIENLRKYSYMLMEETVGALTDGRIEANPLQINDKLPCSYCKYKSICDEYPSSNPRIYAADAEEQIGRIMREGV